MKKKDVPAAATKVVAPDASDKFFLIPFVSCKRILRHTHAYIGLTHVLT